MGKQITTDSETLEARKANKWEITDPVKPKKAESQSSSGESRK